MIDISTAISKLEINDWVLDGNPTNESEFNSSFRKIVGVNPNGTAKKSEDPNDFGITWSEVKAKQTELQNAEPMRLLREERDRRIAETDWRFRSDLSPSQEWKDYCVALRDLPANYSPTFDIMTEDNYPLVKEDATTPWPEEPNDG